MKLLELEQLKVLRGSREVVQGASLSLSAGEVVGLIGPNGAGKTSLLRAALTLLPHQGRNSLAELSPELRALHAAYVAQGREIAWPVSVEQLITLGRAPHKRGHVAAVEAAIAALGLEAFRHRRATDLSGGEQARALMARALAQETPLLVADEPIAGLDPKGQIEMMELFARLGQEGRAVLVSIHDLGLAARYCTRLVLMERGRIVADGAPEAVLCDDLMARVFGISAYRAQTPQGMVFQPLTRVASGGE